MADFEYTVDGHIGLMRFNRPEKLNAITYDMLGMIEDSVNSAASDGRVRAVVLSGEGRAFSAGTDLQQLASDTHAARPPRQATDKTPAPWSFAALSKPTICAVNGAAIGLGAELTSQCDLRIAGASARFGWVFVHRGLIPDTGAGTWLLSRIVGLQNAAYLLYSGETISAEKAAQLGYVMEVVQDTELMERSMALATRVSAGSPLATGEVKRLLYQSLVRPPAEHLTDNRATLNRMFASDDFREGVTSFLEKREPTWNGP